MDTLKISKSTARRFVLGRQGLWPGRRWIGQGGTAEALRTIEAVQMDPLNVVARSHDIVLASRVSEYRPAHLNHLLYNTRQFFDYGGALFIYPTTEFPFWRLPMQRCEYKARWADFAVTNEDLIGYVQTELRLRGPLGNRDFTGQERVNHYRGRKDTALALYYLWLIGDLMIHHRRGFERVYDFREHIVPSAFHYFADEKEAEQFFARKTVAFKGIVSEQRWASEFSGFIERRLNRTQASQWLQMMVQNGEFATVQIAHSKENWLVLKSDIPIISMLEAGSIPEQWQPLTTTTEDEVVFLAPLDVVSTRGRANQLFDFE